jgi:hypothetical protein
VELLENFFCHRERNVPASSEGVTVFYENAVPLWLALHDLAGFEHPSYISDLSLFDFHVLGLLEKGLKGRKFGSGKDFEITMVQ